MSKLLQLNPRDNVAVALEVIPAGLEVNGITVLEPIPMGHKVALHALSPGQSVIKYGYPIGKATQAIPVGSHVHSQNLRSGLEDEAGSAQEGGLPSATPQKSTAPATFLGYLRPDGRVGIRNELWIINTVACVNFPRRKNRAGRASKIWRLRQWCGRHLLLQPSLRLLATRRRSGPHPLAPGQPGPASQCGGRAHHGARLREQPAQGFS